jgi:hypothetical protein
MIRAIDHLVIACPDPDEAARLLESDVGLTATGGGRHAGMGSWNRIVWLADGSYLELLGIDDPDLAARSPVGAAAVRALASGGGLATYALLTDDLDGTLDTLRASGAAFGQPEHGSRTRDDGELVEWWTSQPDVPLAPDGVPFLIRHANVGAEWGPEALAERARFAHRHGSPVRLHALEIRSDDPSSLAATLHDALEVDVWAVSDLAVAEIGPHRLRIVPPHHLTTPAGLVLGADVPARTSAELLNLRFVLEPAAAGEIDPDGARLTSGTG